MHHCPVKTSLSAHFFCCSTWKSNSYPVSSVIEVSPGRSGTLGTNLWGKKKQYFSLRILIVLFDINPKWQLICGARDGGNIYKKILFLTLARALLSFSMSLARLGSTDIILNAKKSSLSTRCQVNLLSLILDEPYQYSSGILNQLNSFVTERTEVLGKRTGNSKFLKH